MSLQIQNLVYDSGACHLDNFNSCKNFDMKLLQMPDDPPFVFWKKLDKGVSPGMNSPDTYFVSPPFFSASDMKSLVGVIFLENTMVRTVLKIS